MAERRELQGIDALNAENKAALEMWLKETGISLVQINGQRKYGGPPPGWTDPSPPSGCEVYIGKIPQDLYEDKLIPLFQSVGQLYEFRLMMTFSGHNRGFAYAKYANRRSAQAAITALNRYELQKDCYILVCRSTEKCELSVDGLPRTQDKEVVCSLLKTITQGVVSVMLYPSLEKNLKRLAVVKYESHRAAAMAKKALIEGPLELWGHQVEVDWLKSETKQKLKMTNERSALDTSFSFRASSLLHLGEKLRKEMPFQYPLPGLRLANPKIVESQPPSFLGNLDQKVEVEIPFVCPGLSLADLKLQFSDIHRNAQSICGNEVAQLNTFCFKKRLGIPAYVIQSCGIRLEGRELFDFQVSIPGFSIPFRGSMWVSAENLMNGQEEVKRSAAQQILIYLGGCPRV
ncbi:dead end protein 1 [Latimeria chalumnae]|uniref:DND microRNA-mediated repression inhibitor 1 n=1 Tax=Latimeria chalumnae TaxID=7897 RepID=M3XI30_LATCH|nr:PREDICTED: dead end protein homolog 1 [Latimeria chalumnae]|eukprot:XP_014353589.1 PREDICTED: dead end protein homolog 1 [Latimeria chalumnae]